MPQANSRHVNAPALAGIAWILIATSVFTFLLIRRRAHPGIWVTFVLMNLFAVFVLLLAQEYAISSYNFYP